MGTKHGFAPIFKEKIPILTRLYLWRCMLRTGCQKKFCANLCGYILAKYNIFTLAQNTGKNQKHNQDSSLDVSKMVRWHFVYADIRHLPVWGLPFGKGDVCLAFWYVFCLIYILRAVS